MLLHISQPAPNDLHQQIEQLWQLDVLLFRSEKLAVQSCLDHEALNILAARTERVKVRDTLRYATSLLCTKEAPLLNAAAEAVMPMLHSTERRLLKDPAKAKLHEADIQNLIEGGCITKLGTEEVDKSRESWFIPHHLHHNGEDQSHQRPR